MTVAGVLVTGAVAKELPAELDEISLLKAYARWAPVYDLVFGAVFERGRRAAVAAAERVGGRILEVGVGTGISLPGYSPQNRIIGIDLSEAMLRKAQQRVAGLSLTNVEKLEVMDAEHLCFVRRSRRQPRNFDRATPGGSARRVRPDAQTGRRDDPPQPHRRGWRLSAPGRTVAATDCLSARLARRVSLGPIRPVDRRANRCPPDRAPADATARPLLAAQVCQMRTSGGSMSTTDFKSS